MKKPYFITKATEEGMIAAGEYMKAAYRGDADQHWPDCPWPRFSPEGRAWIAAWNGCVIPAGFGEEAER